MTVQRELKIGIAGLGAIGFDVAKRIDAGIPGLRLAAVAGGDAAKTAARAAQLRSTPVVVDAGSLGDHADVIVDCAPSRTLRAIIGPAVAGGRTVVTVNAGALLDHLDLVDAAHATGGRIVVASGAILALDALVAAAESEIHSVTLVTRKPPAGLRGAPYLEERGMTLEGLTAPLKVFEGSARDGVKGFPANVNVSAALSLAGIGPDRTRIEIWADPTIDRNMQSFQVEADSARFQASIEGIPSAENPRTGRITALSVVATLRRLIAPLVVGT